MIGVTGYPLRYWVAVWQQTLRDLPAPKQEQIKHEVSVRQEVRLGDMLADRGHLAESFEYAKAAAAKAPTQPTVRFRWAATQLRTSPDPSVLLQGMGELSELAGLDGEWLGLHGRLLREAGDRARAEAEFRLATAVDPYTEQAACEGVGAPFELMEQRTLPTDPTRRALCVEARKLLEH